MATRGTDLSQYSSDGSSSSRGSSRGSSSSGGSDVAGYLSEEEEVGSKAGGRPISPSSILNSQEVCVCVRARPGLPVARAICVHVRMCWCAGVSQRTACS